MTKKNFFVGVCYHRPAPVIKTEILQPIQVGAALAKSKLDFAVTDDTGKNISNKNKTWCEITAAYWMRHNVQAEYYGLMHYRRLLSFSPKVKADRSFVRADERDYKRFGWNDQAIRDFVNTTDIVTSPKRSIYPVGLPGKVMTNYNMYARDHRKEDLNACIEICRATNEDIFPFLLQTLKDTTTRFGNISIMRCDLFFEYVDWMVTVLEETECQLDTSSYDAYQSRVIGFLAERLTETYFRYAQSAKGAKIKELSVAFNAKPPQPALVSEAITAAAKQVAQKVKTPRSPLEPINITFAVDDEYAKHAAATVHSVLLNAKIPERYHCYIFHKGDLTNGSYRKLKQVTNGFGAQISSVEIPIGSLRWLPTNRAHTSMTTYYRLVMHNYLPTHVHRIIYMDADTLAMAPLEELWESNLDDNIIGAAPDEGGVLQSRRLRMSVSHRYFNAGVLILDMNELRKADLNALVQNAFEDRGEYITLQDQDLLNIIFENKTTSLDLKWNVNNRIFVRNDLDPSYSDDQARTAAQNPAILHFTDTRKPWHAKCYNPYYDLYWFHRNHTPWAETKAERSKRKLRRWLWCNLNSKYKQNIADALAVGGRAL
ncbi:DUF4422 domain-containing protein [uncultured Tateyamaria sp.]|uniref:DUF4422 domain-containing protein n=1 Tax=uncultured Tateyamaria sp. TaxID=455651 RepID=UPI002624B29C|nr:DUF4422 domain-containing protein [uncultured Tateyamaria sp.]